MPDARWPRLSFFLCQQHRPELIYVPEWLDHPNTVFGICGLTVVADDRDHEALLGRFEGLYGSADVIEGGFKVGTANGPIRVQSKQVVENEFGPLPSAITAISEPCIIAMDLRYRNAEQLQKWIANSDLDYKQVGETFTLTNSGETGNTFFRFCRQ